MKSVIAVIVVAVSVCFLTACEPDDFSHTDLYGNTNRIPTEAEEWFWE